MTKENEIQIENEEFWWEALDDFVDITHLGSTSKEFMAEVVRYMQRNHKNPFLSVAEGIGEVDVTGIANGVAVTTEA